MIVRLLILVLMVASPALAAVVYVQAGATGTGDGGSWANACPTLQAGLAKAASGDQVWVAQGTYTPGTSRSDTFTIPDGVAVYGGFLGTETALGQRRDDPGLCLLSGEIGGPGYADNSECLVTLSGSGRLDTVTVTLANNDNVASPNAAGLVATASGANVAVVRCRFTHNRAYGPQIILIQNAASVLIDRSEIRDSAELAFQQASVGTIWFDHCTTATMSHSVVDGVFPQSTLDFTTSVYFNACGSGGLSNCVLANCQSVDATRAPLVEACTFVGNRGRNTAGGIIRGCLVEPTAVGSTLSFPTISENNWITSSDGDPQFANRASPAGPDGIWLTADDGLRLQATSPCIDQARFITATSNQAMPLDDILGTPRPQGRHPDCGAYEFPTGNAGPFAVSRTVPVREDVLTPVALTGTDADGNALTARVLSLPAAGVLLPTTDGTTASGPALGPGDLPYTVANAGGIVLFQAAANEFGTPYASIGFLVNDGLVDSDPGTVTIDVLSVNDAPTIDPVGNQTVLEDSGQTLVALTGISAGTPSLPVGDPGREVQGITITATSSDPAVIPDPTVSYTSPAATASLAFAPTANANGSVTITVTVHDDGGTANGGIDTTVTTFTVNVVPVNDPPQIAPVANLTLPEDCSDPALTTVTLTGIAPGPPDEATQSLSLSAVSSDTSVVGIGGIDYTPGATTAQLHLALVPNANGSALVFISLFDDGGTANGGSDATARVFRVTVTPVEDLPVLAVNTGVTAITGQTTVIGADHLRLTDADLPPDSSLVFTLATAPATGTVRLNGSDLAAGGTWTQADVDAGRLAYAQSGGTAANDSFTITWSDGIGPDQGPATVVVTLIGSSLPVISVPGPGVTWTEGTPPVAVAATALVSDADPLPWDHGSITATLTTGAATGDALTLADEGSGAGEVGVAGSALTYGGQAIGTWSGGSGGTPLVVTFTTTAATPAAAQAVVRRLRFANAGGNPGAATRTVRLVVNDGAAGASVPADATVAVVPVDNPPTVTTTWLAVPAGVTMDVDLGVSDPDSTAFTWTLVGTPALADVSLIDASRGRLRITAHAGSSGRESLHVTVSDLVNPPVPAVIELVVSGLDDARPQAAGELPPDAYASGLLDATVRFDCSDLGGTSGLTFQPTADAPAGVTLDPVGTDQVRIRWLIPAGGTAYYQRFGIIATDPASQTAGMMPLLVLVLPQPGGGG